MGRMRSPNYPIIPLEDAISAAKAIWDKNRKAPISREAGVKDIGYSGLTGRSLQVLGALNQYGLTEITGKGQMRVTQTAEDIFVGYPEEVKRKAIARAGHSPSLFRDIYDKFEGIVPGENAVRSFLFQRGFTNEGVGKALKTFLDTNRYVEVYGDSEGYRPAQEPAAESEPQQEREAPQVHQQVIDTTPEVVSSRRTVVVDEGNLDFNLSSAGVSLTGRTEFADDLLAFVEKLRAIAVLLPTKPKDEFEELIG